MSDKSNFPRKGTFQPLIVSFKDRRILLLLFFANEYYSTVVNIDNDNHNNVLYASK
jgi:hypothetical protein